MSTGHGYAIDSNEKLRDRLIKFNVWSLNCFSEDRDGNKITEGHELYELSKYAVKAEKSFNEGQSLLEKQIPKYVFNGPGPLELINSVKYYNMAKKQKNLDSLFLEKGKDFTWGFLSNFHVVGENFLRRSVSYGMSGLPNFSGIKRWKNKINYKEQYNSAIKALVKINAKE